MASPVPLRAAALGLVLAAGLADAASAVVVIAEVRASRGGLPTEGAALSAVVDPGADPDVLIWDFKSAIFEFVPVGGGVAGVGSLDEGLARQVPDSPPVTDDMDLGPVFDRIQEIRDADKKFDKALSLLDPGSAVDVFGLNADPDPFLSLSVAYDNPDGSLIDPTLIQHFTSTELVPLDGALASVSVLGLLLEDGDGDGDAMAQAFLRSGVGNVSGLLPGGQFVLSEPGLQVTAWQGGPITPDLGPDLDGLFMNLDVIVTPGDRFTAFATTILVVPEPSTLPLLACGLAALALRPRRRQP